MREGQSEYFKCCCLDLRKAFDDNLKDLNICKICNKNAVVYAQEVLPHFI